MKKDFIQLKYTSQLRAEICIIVYIHTQHIYALARICTNINKKPSPSSPLTTSVIDSERLLSISQSPGRMMYMRRNIYICCYTI